MFFFNHRALAAELLDAHRRGVTVRVIADLEASEVPDNAAVLNELLAAKIPVFLGKSQRNSKIHTKFAIVDNQRVLTGSANWTGRGMTANAEDILAINDPDLAAQYTQAFELHIPLAITKEKIQPKDEGRRPATRNTVTEKILTPSLARPFRFTLDAPPEVFFSPRERPPEKITQDIQAAQHTITVLMYEFHDQDLREQLARAAERGINVRILFDYNGVNTDIALERLRALAARGITIAIYKHPEDAASMHLKAAVIDNAIVWTGSANWSRGAFYGNFEDTLRLSSRQLAEKYQALADRLFKTRHTTPLKTP